jgi:hypothetical protein
MATGGNVSGTPAVAARMAGGEVAVIMIMIMIMIMIIIMAVIISLLSGLIGLIGPIRRPGRQTHPTGPEDLDAGKLKLRSTFNSVRSSRPDRVGDR